MSAVPSDPAARRPAATRGDVARLAGVSTAVVSYVLNGSKSVRPETEERVRAAVAKLGYRPNAAARALSRGASDLLGIVVPNATNPFFAHFTHEVDLAADKRGMTLLAANADESAGRERRLIEGFVDRRVDGILLASTGAIPHLRTLVPPDLPVVLINRYDAVPGFRTVGIDLFEGARIAVEHLAEHGHRTVGLIAGTAPDGVPGPREIGWRAAIDRYSVAAGPVIREGFTMSGGHAAGRRLIAEGTVPSALFVSSDQLAMGLLLALHEAGLRVPEDVAIVSFDGTPESAYAWPPLTTLAQPIAEMARAGVAAVLDPDGPRGGSVFAPVLVRRASCGC
ncbi:LacI family DNA-binding transcriptional regulator [Microbacterium gorillae]|uniref:LacI family DNA-binding transcriptional regulator n=1 Tax=Microbacterium gorillae TaxID=1231063 RepID=UPI00058DFC65|nr:LacI family DNA-binding transcriptional regulator [Microbacterium gorillae]